MKKEFLKIQFSHQCLIYVYIYIYNFIDFFFMWEKYCFNDNFLRKLDEMSKLNKFEIQRTKLNENKIRNLN